ncbi:MAG TPA: DNA mismatch repair endonuclease MutL [Anaerolineales bacterium]|nr:DNA mismatch repair endonuclease MutL [Anaerolineales bacterium]
MKIRILPPEIASQIAAGEVVERPASVVKELVENAIDAGARSIGIKIEGAGRGLIEVADDGGGIPPSELALAVERHATSKLVSSEDLFRIGSLGFRGEALASIGSISRLTITSAVRGEAGAARLRVEAGHAVGVEPVGAPPGTLVRVEDLFFNVPARLKFLKTDATERRQISELVTRYALAYPEIRFSLDLEGASTIRTTGSGDRRDALTALYGPEIARQMLVLDSEQDGFRLEGFTSTTGLTRSNRREITIFVNGRLVQEAGLATALIQAYHTMLMVGRYPMAFLFLTLPPETVDVNVHPAKSEIRLRDRNRVFTDLQRSVRRALLAHTPVHGVETPGNLRWGLPDAEPGRGDDRPVWGGGRPVWGGGTSGPLPYSQPSASDVPQPAFPERGHIPLLRLIGQIASAYLVAEGPDGLYLIDQHAAHERVLFERLMGQRRGEIASQALLAPEAIDLPPHQSGLVAGQLETLAGLGFEVEQFGGHTFLVRALPALLAGLSPDAALRVLVEDFEEDETPLGAEQEARIIARVCKRAAVKAGQVLSTAEQEALLRDLERCDSPRTCPHGRPTMIHLSVDLLERQFGRRGAR